MNNGQLRAAAAGKLGAATGAYIFPMLLGPGGASNPSHKGIQNSMLICSFVAFCGVVVTYIFIPTYSPQMLAVEGKYIALDHECMRPPAEEMVLLDVWGNAAIQDGSGLSSNNSTMDDVRVNGDDDFVMQQIVLSADDYSMGNLTPKGGGSRGHYGRINDLTDASELEKSPSLMSAELEEQRRMSIDKKKKHRRTSSLEV